MLTVRVPIPVNLQSFTNQEWRDAVLPTGEFNIDAKHRLMAVRGAFVEEPIERLPIIAISRDDEAGERQIVEFHAVRKVLEAASANTTDSPGCTMPKELKDSDPATRLLSSKLQPVISILVLPTLVNSTNSALMPSYINSVIRICETAEKESRLAAQRVNSFLM